DESTVAYDSQLWKRADHMAEGESREEEARVLQVGRLFVFIPGGIEFDGKRQLVRGEASDRLEIVSREGERRTYDTTILSNEELFAFYRPEIAGIVTLSWIYLALLVVSAAFSWGQRYYLQTSANRIIQDMRNKIFAQLNRLQVQYFDNLPA